jgi:DNA-binding transcriptional ArsR family regulator
MTDVDRVIHEPARLIIVALLASVEEADFLWIQRESGLTKGNLSSHLGKLEEARYVQIEKTYKGKVPLTVLRLTRDGKAALEAYRKDMNGLLAGVRGRGARRAARAVGARTRGSGSLP